MIENYDTLNETCQQTLTGPWRLTSSGFYSGPYDPKEPLIADIEAVDPDYESSFGEYGDAAIVVIGRPGGENRDYERGGVAEGLGAEEPLELTTNERDIIDKAAEHFEKVIVLLNCTSPMEIGELKDNDKVDSVLWVGHPGNYGTLGIADILCGRVSCTTFMRKKECPIPQWSTSATIRSLILNLTTRGSRATAEITQNTL